MQKHSKCFCSANCPLLEGAPRRWATCTTALHQLRADQVPRHTLVANGPLVLPNGCCGVIWGMAFGLFLSARGRANLNGGHTQNPWWRPAHPFQLTPPKWGCVGKSMARAREPDGAKGLKHHPLGVQPAQMPPNALPHGGTPHGQRSQVGVGGV